MPVSRSAFEALIRAMGDRWYPLSSISEDIYYQLLRDKFVDDALFQAVVMSLYKLEQPKFPSPQQFLDTLAIYRHPAYQAPTAAALPAARDLTLAEMDPKEREACQANIERIKQMLSGLKASRPRSTAGFSTFGQALAGEAQEASLEVQVQERRAWLRDPIMRREAMEWAMTQEGVVPVCNEVGELVDLEVAS